MKEYIISIVAVALLGALISLISPDGEGGGILRNVKAVIGVCIVVVCIGPFLSFISSLTELKAELLLPPQSQQEYDYTFDSAYGAAEISSLKDGIKAILKDKFDIEDTECRITVSISEGRRLERVFVTLYGSAIWKDTGEIEDYLGKLFGCEIVTAIG